MYIMLARKDIWSCELPGKELWDMVKLKACMAAEEGVMKSLSHEGGCMGLVDLLVGLTGSSKGILGKEKTRMLEEFLERPGTVVVNYSSTASVKDQEEHMMCRREKCFQKM